MITGINIDVPGRSGAILCEVLVHVANAPERDPLVT